VPELAHFGIHSLRELIERPYRIVYRVASDTVTVVALLDGGRDLEDVLLERLVRL
jgi:toxin ParE1/3/4